MRQAELTTMMPDDTLFPASRIRQHPRPHEDFYKEYHDYIRNLLRNAGIPSWEIADVASEIMVKMVERDIIGMYDSKYTSKGYATPVPMKGFVRAWVLSYSRSWKERVIRHHSRQFSLSHPLTDNLELADTLPDSRAARDQEVLHARLELEYLASQLGDELLSTTKQVYHPNPRLVDILNVMLRDPDNPCSPLQVEYGISYNAANRWCGVVKKKIQEISRNTLV